MGFTDGIFFAFLALLFIIYYILPQKVRWISLLAGSFVFYCFSGFIFYILLTVISTYVFSRILDKYKKRIFLIVWLIAHIGLLALVKSPVMPDISASGYIIPLGISFYTFQSAGYMIDIYRQKATAEKNPLKLALFISFFPQLIQGPISRFNDLTKTLFTPDSFSIENIAYGLQRMLWGFFKKLVIADRMLGAVILMSSQTEIFHGGYALLNIILYAAVLYADFTGGIDIAIGAARLFGVNITENFKRPFYSTNIAEYWRRWHITMGSWFRDYVFYPMSASLPMRRFSRFSRDIFGNGFGRRLPVYITTIVTWLLTGLWHGITPNFIAWGLANGFVIILSQECMPLYAKFHSKFASIGNTRIYNAFAVARTFILMCMIRSFDIYESVGTTFYMIAGIFRPWNLEAVSIGVTYAEITVAVAGITLLILSGISPLRRWYENLLPAGRLFLCMLLLCAVLVFGVYGYGYDSNQFIYNQF